MKKKKLTVGILSSLCIVIWGTIAWKIYSALYDNTPVIPQTSIKNIKEVTDTLALLLNYRDPFLDGYPDSEKKEEKKVIESDDIIEKYIESTPEVLPDFQYKGIIRLGRNTQAMILWNDRNLMLSTKDKIGEFTILQIGDDKLIVSRENKKYELSIQ